jgi:dipeptidyl aminopeptidase/acylaminoacyl peptidase
MLSRLTVLTGAVVAIGLISSAVARAFPDSPRKLTVDTLLDIKHPSDPVWSPDGTHVAFIWDRAGAQNVWVADPARGSSAPRNLTRADAGTIQGIFWSRDGRTIYFGRDGDLWQTAADGSTLPHAVWTTKEAESGIAPSPDGDRVAFVRSGDIWVRSLVDNRESRLTNTQENESAPVWSPDGARLAYAVSASVRRSHGPDFWGTKVLFAWTERTMGPATGIVTVANGATVSVQSTPGYDSGIHWIDATRLLIQHIPESYKSRQIVVAGAIDGSARVVHEDVDSKWWGLTYDSAEPQPSPDGEWIAFLSDRDGRDHLYVVATDGTREAQLTHGPFDVGHAAWSPDSRRIAFESNEGGPPGRKQISVASLDPRGSVTRTTTITAGKGAHTQPVWSPSGEQILFEQTDPRNSADLYVTRASAVDARAQSTRLTNSMPAGIDRDAFVEPQLVWYPSSDGQQVPASLFVPPRLDRSRKHPAIVWIHGDLVTQNYEGWHVRRDYGVYYSFHQYLLQKGFVVLAPDYRGSIGYGKDWRQGVYRDLGGQEYRDVAAGVEFLKTLGYVDTDRLGVWGLSYGGFLTLKILTMEPTLFRCGVDVAGVTDYGDYERDPGQRWLTARMGTRQDNPKVYEQSAPILRADRIVRPLLILGGTADTNVPFEQTARLVDALLKSGKDIELMIYPGELHYFHREHVLRDAWSRVERFFAAQLDPRAARTADGRD